ncbi:MULTISPECIES: hypothetical protein [unclassified Streptomyces]|nr:hypothetical protein [Streptomyces sp. CB02488]WRZ15931.1 hypothetical protein OG892_36595 [Streptomyces sp. NBC_00341]
MVERDEATINAALNPYGLALDTHQRAPTSANLPAPDTGGRFSAAPAG